MRPIFKALPLSTLFFLAACAPKGEAERSGNWTLNPLQSSISYVTIKSGPLGEINTFNEISGGVSTGGKAEFVIALDSVHTNSETRDPRMKEHVFETAKYPEAKVTANLNMTQFEVLAIGNSKTVSLDMKLDMHGLSMNENLMYWSPASVLMKCVLILQHRLYSILKILVSKRA